MNAETVSEIMIHRKDIFAIEISDDISEKLNEIDEYKYSRIPIYDETIDNIKGILFVKDILKSLSTKKQIIDTKLQIHIKMK